MLVELLWDLGDEVRHRDEETTPHFCMGPSTVRAPKDSGFGSTRSMDGGILHWAGGEAPASGFMDRRINNMWVWEEGRASAWWELHRPT